MSDAARIVVVGSVGIDTVHTPNATRENVPGGSAPYFAYAAGLFAPVQFVGVVGNDYPDEHRAILQQRNIDLEGLELDPDKKTFSWEGRYLDNFMDRETLRTDLNALETFEPKLPDAYKNAEYVFLANGTPSIQAKVLDQMDGSQRLVAADTMNLWIDIMLDDLKALLPRIDMLILNDEEARMLSGKFTMPDCAKAILDMGPIWVLIKKGEHGSICFGSDLIVQVPAFPLLEVVDPTGAGDSYAGGLIGKLAELNAVPGDTDKLRTAMAYASVMGSFTCEGFGFDGLSAMDAASVDQRVDALREMCRIP